MGKFNLTKILFFSFLLVFSCNKENEEVIIDDTPEIITPVAEINRQNADDVVIAESTINEIFNVLFFQAIQSPDLNGFDEEPDAEKRDCPDETVISENNNGWYPKIYTLDFGPSCEVNGSIISGVISARFSAPINANNMNIEVIEMTDFVLNTCAVEMKDDALILAIRNGSVSGNKKFEIDTDELCITGPEGNTINLGFTWSTLVLDENGTYFDNDGWPALLDDRMVINVMTALFEDDGVEFEAKTITGFPLVYEFGCHWIKEGQFQIDEIVGTYDPPQPTQILDYGFEDGACDNLVLVTIGNDQYVVECP